MAADIVREAVLPSRPGPALHVGEAGEVTPKGVILGRAAALTAVGDQAWGSRARRLGGAGVEGGREQAYSFWEPGRYTQFNVKSMGNYQSS